MGEHRPYRSQVTAYRGHTPHAAVAVAAEVDFAQALKSGILVVQSLPVVDAAAFRTRLEVAEVEEVDQSLAAVAVGQDRVEVVAGARGAVGKRCDARI